MTQERDDVHTRERLLETAEGLFAERGFHAVSVREITKAAGCHLGAVNYHFGSKKNLYLEVFESRWIPRARRLQEGFRRMLETVEDESPADVVGALAKSFLEGPLTDEEKLRHHQLMAREMAKPSEAMDSLAKTVMKPFLKELAQRLRPALPEGVSEERLMLSILCVFSMVLYFNFARVAVSRITGRDYDLEFNELIVRQIIGFSLNGLSGLGREEG